MGLPEAKRDRAVGRHRTHAAEGGGLYSNVKGDFNHTVVNGRATFLGLYFDKAGYPYKLRYYTDANVFPNFVDSINLTVGVGPAYEIDIRQQPGGARGGIPLTLQV